MTRETTTGPTPGPTGHGTRCTFCNTVPSGMVRANNGWHVFINTPHGLAIACCWDAESTMRSALARAEGKGGAR